MDQLHHMELNLPPDIWRPFAQQRWAIRCPAGYLIYLQNTAATCFYYLKSGQVKSFIQSPDGGERVLNLYQAGSLFGEASFFDELPRVSSAVAMTPCELVPIDRELLSREFAAHPELALAMMKYLARTVRLLSDQVDQMAFRPARWRVARFLTVNAGGNGRVSCPQEEIAATISVSRVTVSRILNQLDREGLISLGYRSVQILDRPGLEALCE